MDLLFVVSLATVCFPLIFGSYCLGRGYRLAGMFYGALLGELFAIPFFVLLVVKRGVTFGEAIQGVAVGGAIAACFWIPIAFAAYLIAKKQVSLAGICGFVAVEAIAILLFIGSLRVTDL